MRRFPCSWDKTLAQLGFRRKRRRFKDDRHRMCRLESLEVRAMPPNESCVEMYLRDIGISADHAIVERFRGGFVGRFSTEVVCVVELFLSQLPPRTLDSGNFAKVHFYFTDEIDTPPEKGHVKELIDVLTLPWPFDFATYVNAEPYAKKMMTLDSMTAGLRWLGRLYNWKVALVDQTYGRCLEHDLRMQAFLKQSWLSPCKRYRVRVFYTCDIDEMTLEAVLYKNRSRKELARVPLGSDIPSPAAALYAEGKWIEQTMFTLKTGSWRTDTAKADFSQHVQPT